MKKILEKLNLKDVNIGACSGPGAWHSDRAGKELVSRKIGEVTTLAIPLGIATIVIAWILTAIYVAWANKSYDPEVERLKGELKR